MSTEAQAILIHPRAPHSDSIAPQIALGTRWALATFEESTPKHGCPLMLPYIVSACMIPLCDHRI